jgi:hypothetical protein
MIQYGVKLGVGIIKDRKNNAMYRKTNAKHGRKSNCGCRVFN